jgi:hypothetical protein
MTILFLFGAGASCGSGRCFWRTNILKNPPLGKNLFSELLREGGYASMVSSDLAEIFLGSFEKGMDKFYESNNTQLSGFLRDMAKYFVGFNPGRGNYYHELIKIIRKAKPVIVTTNYDLLIEKSLYYSGLEAIYGPCPIHQNGFSVLKIHGSCNFWPIGINIHGIGFDISAVKNASILGSEIGVESINGVYKRCNIEDSIGPAIALYSPSKQMLYGKQFVETQKNYWLKLANEASVIYVIGLAVNTEDHHIWGTLGTCPGVINYVGGEGDVFLNWSKNNGRTLDNVIANTFKDSLSVIKDNMA